MSTHALFLSCQTSPDEPLDPENFEFVKSTTIASPYPLYSTFRELYRTTIWKLTFVKIVRGDSSTKSAVHFAGTMLSPPEMSGVPLYGRVHEIEPNLLRWSFVCLIVHSALIFSSFLISWLIEMRARHANLELRGYTSGGYEFQSGRFGRLDDRLAWSKGSFRYSVVANLSLGDSLMVGPLSRTFLAS